MEDIKAGGQGRDTAGKPQVHDAEAGEHALMQRPIASHGALGRAFL